VTVHFWDAAGKPLGQAEESWVLLGKDFLLAKVDADAGPVFATPPAGTHSVSVALGSAGPVTDKILLPKRPPKGEKQKDKN
jgi:hypothetical protein